MTKLKKHKWGNKKSFYEEIHEVNHLMVGLHHHIIYFVGEDKFYYTLVLDIPYVVINNLVNLLDIIYVGPSHEVGSTF